MDFILCVNSIGKRQQIPTCITYANQYGHAIKDLLEDLDHDTDDDNDSSGYNSDSITSSKNSLIVVSTLTSNSSSSSSTSNSDDENNGVPGDNNNNNGNPNNNTFNLPLPAIPPDTFTNRDPALQVGHPNITTQSPPTKSNITKVAQQDQVTTEEVNKTNQNYPYEDVNDAHCDEDMQPAKIIGMNKLEEIKTDMITETQEQASHQPIDTAGLHDNIKEFIEKLGKKIDEQISDLKDHYDQDGSSQEKIIITKEKK